MLCAYGGLVWSIVQGCVEYLNKCAHAAGQYITITECRTTTTDTGKEYSEGCRYTPNK